MIAVGVLHDLMIRSVEWAICALGAGLVLWTIREERRDRSDW